MVARPADLPALSGLLDRHDSLYDAALVLPRIAELRGRGVALVVELSGQRCVLRHYHRGGAVAHALGDRYLRLAPNRVLTELATSEAARTRGVATPVVMCGTWYDHGLFRRSDIATVYIPSSKDLAAVLFSDVAPPQSAVAATAHLIRSMLQAGLLHRDLNLKNILIADQQAYILDLDRCTLQPRITGDQAGAMRQRLFRSLLKWEHRTGRRVHDTTRNALREAFDGAA